MRRGSGAAVVLVLVSFCVFGREVGAYECDNFTDRDRPIKDSLVVLDAYTNGLLEKALFGVNEINCDRSVLFDAFEAEMGQSLPRGVVEEWANETPLVERIRDNPNEWNIYTGVSLAHYPVLAIKGVGSSIRLAGELIGTDKLGHFMAEGYKTYTRIVEEGGSFEKAMLWSIGTEEGYFGLWFSGVKSYADLAANYGGAKFWGSVLDGPNPYFVCADGKFIKARQFTWKDYVNKAWDEGINCSQFSTHLGGVVRGNLSKLGMTCPVQGYQEACASLVNLEDSIWYVSPICHYMAFRPDAIVDPDKLIAPGRRGD